MRIMFKGLFYTDLPSPGPTLVEHKRGYIMLREEYIVLGEEHTIPSKVEFLFKKSESLFAAIAFLLLFFFLMILLPLLGIRFIQFMESLFPNDPEIGNKLGAVILIVSFLLLLFAPIGGKINWVPTHPLRWEDVELREDWVSEHSTGVAFEVTEGDSKKHFFFRTEPESNKKKLISTFQMYEKRMS